MKELITEMTLKVTSIEEVDDTQLERTILDDRNVVKRREFEKRLKEQLCLDGVKVIDMQHFIREIGEEAPADSFVMNEKFIDILAEKVAEKLCREYKPVAEVVDNVVEKVGSGFVIHGGC